MNKQTEALKLAREGVEIHSPNMPEYKVCAALIETLAQPEQEFVCSTGLCHYKAQPEQEPVALETVYETIIQWDEGGGKRSRRELARRIVSLYTTPPQRKPLTDEEIWKFWWSRPEVPDGEDDSMEAEFVAAVRRVLAAHGIKE